MITQSHLLITKIQKQANTIKFNNRKQIHINRLVPNSLIRLNDLRNQIRLQLSLQVETTFQVIHYLILKDKNQEVLSEVIILTIILLNQIQIVHLHG